MVEGEVLPCARGAVDDGLERFGDLSEEERGVGMLRRALGEYLAEDLGWEGRQGESGFSRAAFHDPGGEREEEL